MENDSMWTYGLLSMVLMATPLSMFIYTNVTIENGVIDWPLTGVGVLVFVSGLVIAYLRVYPMYKGIEGVRTGEDK